jgi:small-conductance mechanosensitive channel
MLAVRQKVDADSVVVYFINFGDSALEVLVRCYVFEADWGQFTAEREAINLAVMDIVEGHGLTIAFPTQSIIVENVSDLVGDKRPSRDTTPILPLRSAQKPAERIPQADEADGGADNYDEMDDAD